MGTAQKRGVGSLTETRHDGIRDNHRAEHQEPVSGRTAKLLSRPRRSGITGGQPHQHWDMA